MNAEQALVGALAADATVAGLVEDRISPKPAAESGGLPCVTYTRAGAERVYSHSGFSDLTFPDLYVSAWASTYAGAKALAQAVENVLHSNRFIIQSDNDGFDAEANAWRVLLIVRVAQEGR